jgi:hypothetical protein
MSLHGIKCQKKEVFIVTAVRTSDLTGAGTVCLSKQEFCQLNSGSKQQIGESRIMRNQGRAPVSSVMDFEVT